jgi:hypothetical protein
MEKIKLFSWGYDIFVFTFSTTRTCINFLDTSCLIFEFDQPNFRKRKINNFPSVVEREVFFVVTILPCTT